MPDKKYRVLTDSACDLPFAMAEKHRIDILSFGITVDGKAYTERIDFNFEEYYEILRTCEGVPSTAHVTVPRFLAKFEEYDDAGVQDVLYVSINGSGSATLDAATMAKKEFYASRPGSTMNICLVDSHCYSMAYGWPLLHAEEKLAAGESIADVEAWLNDVFTRVEIILGAFSLKFMKKSGRISAAAAFAGELLGLRPIISLNDGVSTVRKKVRGDKEVPPALLQYAGEHRVGGDYLVGGTDDAVIAGLAALCEEKWGEKPVATFKLGAAVATNTGPDAVAIVYMGKPRTRG